MKNYFLVISPNATVKLNESDINAVKEAIKSKLEEEYPAKDIKVDGHVKWESEGDGIIKIPLLEKFNQKKDRKITYFAYVTIEPSTKKADKIDIIPKSL